MQILQIDPLSVTVQLMVSAESVLQRHAYAWAGVFSSQVAFDCCVENEWAEMNGGKKLGRISGWPPAFHTKRKQQMGPAATLLQYKVRVRMNASLRRMEL